jgi:hypothetical protein
LPPFFFPPFAAFFAIFLVPPFKVVWCAGSNRTAMSLPPGTRTRTCGAGASLPAPRAHRSFDERELDISGNFDTRTSKLKIQKRASTKKGSGRFL